MTKETMTVWHHDETTEVLQQKEANRFYIPLGYVDSNILRSLGAAICDALTAEPGGPNVSAAPAQGASISNPAHN
jgi:hypothetical protein